MKASFIRILLLVLCNSLAMAQTLSDKAQLSLITCGPTQQEVYSAFGHSAFRVYDPVLNIDAVYNYGIFDFDQPNFNLNFARGHLRYKLGVYNYQNFKAAYIYNNRFIHEQVLNLSPKQLQKVFDYLQWNSLPENEYYLYDYFYNNCSTKLRDVLVTALGKEITFDGSYIKTNYTIRELTDFYLKKQPWGDLGIDIGLGLPMDKKATPYEYMFLPDYLESGFDHAYINQGGKNVPAVKEKLLIYEERAELTEGLPNPLYVFSFLTLITLLLSTFDFKRKKLSTWFDVILFGSTGFLGILLLLLWLATDHRAAANNLNILWALPTHFIIIFLFITQPKCLDKYFLITAIIAGVLLISWPVFPQKLHYALIPVVLTLGIRAFTQYRLRSYLK